MDKHCAVDTSKLGLSVTKISLADLFKVQFVSPDYPEPVGSVEPEEEDQHEDHRAAGVAGQLALLHHAQLH